MRRNFVFLLTSSCLIVSSTAARTVYAQNAADRQTIRKEQALYYSGPAPASIACDALVDWEAFLKQVGAAGNDAAAVRRLEAHKAIKVSFISNDENHTDVLVKAPKVPPQELSDGLRDHVSAFMQLYWSLGFGGLLPAPDAAFQIHREPNGYAVVQVKAKTRVTTQVDRAGHIVKSHIDMPSSAADVTPSFSRERDGLLHIRHILEAVDMGTSKMFVEASFDYQQVGGFYIPSHVEMILPDSLNFSYVFSACKVEGKSKASTHQTPAR